MIRRSRSNWTAVAVNEVFPVFFAKSGCATEFLENAECSIDSLFAGFTAQLAQMFLGHTSSSCPHSGTQSSRFYLAGEYRHQKRHKSPVRFRKEMFGFRTESIRDVRFAE